MTTTPPVAQRHLPSLTGLRWFAAFAVFTRHAQPFLTGTPLARPFEHLATPGSTGVSFFFMLSGFVLAWSYQRETGARDFYRRRIARIVPSYWVVVTIALLLVLRGSLDINYEQQSVWRALTPFTLLQSWVPDPTFYYAGPGATWSLSTEAFFYLVFPVLIVRLAPMRTRRLVSLIPALVVVAIVIPLVAGSSRQDGGVGFWLIYICPPVRLLEFALGMLLGLLLRRSVRLPLPLTIVAAIALGGYVVAGDVPIYAGWVAVTIVPFALLIYAFAQADVAGRRTVVAARPLVALGRWSFAFYLVHIPIIRVIEVVAGGATGTAAALVLWVGALGISISAAYVLYRFVEVPFERQIRSGARRAAPKAVPTTPVA